MTDDVMTEAPLEGAQAGADVSEFVEWDSEVTGLGRRFRAASAPRWIVQTRVDGKSRKHGAGGNQSDHFSSIIFNALCCWC